MKKYLVLFASLATILSSCVEDNMYTGPSNFESMTYAPAAVLEDTEVTVTATITYLNGGITAELYYTVNDAAEQKVAMTADGDVFTGVIPATANANNDEVVKFWIVANNVDGIPAKSEVMKYTVGDIPPDYTQLRLNELSGLDKFIEIYNKGEYRVKLEGIYIQKDDALNWTCDDRILEPGEYLLLYSEDVKTSHTDHDPALIFSSGLSAKKNVRIQLFDPTGVSIDDFNIVPHPGGGNVGGSYGRNADGKWYVQPTQTPGAENVDGTQSIESFF